MVQRIRIFRADELICETNGMRGETLLQCAAAAGVFLDAQCGGMGKCGKCLVRLSPDGEKVLACRTMVDGNADVYLPGGAEMKIAGDGTVARTTKAEPPPMRAQLGVAADIGTTTVVAHLIDIGAGTRIATASGVNSQRVCGADVISRIRYCAENGHETLTGLIREQLATLIQQTCSVSGEQARDIGYVSIAGNTIMQHLAAGYSPVGMGTAPFTPVSLFGRELPAWEGLPAAKTAKVYFAPAVSSYVGGDITAGMLAAGLEDIKGPAIYLDIGTNGEIVVKSGDIYYCCATAAGPAFEGAEVTMGMAAVSGAISHVKWERGLKASVIDDAAPRGICGSGLLDALAVLLETGAVDETGRLLGANEIDHDIAAHIGKQDGKNVLRLTGNGGGVYLSAMDIRKLQLAKAAIAAGIQTLLGHAGIREEQVESLVLAGGFGSFLDPVSAVRIGLFPKKFLSIAQALGNTAGEGAALALCSKAARTGLEDIRKRCKNIQLSTDPVFNERFVMHMSLKN